MNRPGLVVFDLAGTTVIDPDGVGTCLREALQNVGVHSTVAETNAVMGIPKPEAIRTLLTQHQRTDLLGSIDAIHADFTQRMIHFYQTDPRVSEIPGALRTFAVLHQAGIKVALNTGFFRDITETLLKRLNWLNTGYIDATMCSDEVPRGRPYPDMIQALMKQLGISDSRHVAKVGDTPSDLGEGTSAGCGWVIGVTEGSHSREQLLPHPHTHLVKTVADLPALFDL
ncbi:MAG: HAD hydrolase-like protein [Gemmatales bacterium]